MLYERLPAGWRSLVLITIEQKAAMWFQNLFGERDHFIALAAGE
jgi:hypothetical protein